jgi:hypothetical protein
MASRSERQITRRQADFLWRAFIRYVGDGYLESWEAGSKTGRSESGARQALVRMEARGLVCRENDGTIHKWSITDAGKQTVREVLGV